MQRTRLGRGYIKPLISTAFLLFLLRPIFCTPDYAVQPHPIVFTEEPQSQTVLEGSNVTLHCNFSVTELGSNYPVPHIVWRKNGAEIAGERDSELHLQSIQLEDAGYYECLAVDGKRKFKEDPSGEGRYLTSSRRAYLTVLAPSYGGTGSGSGSDLMLPGMEPVTVLRGEPVLLPCQPSSAYLPSRVEWYQNGTQIGFDNSGVEVLSDGSLLLLSPTTGDSGTYQCTSWLLDQVLSTQSFDVTVLRGAYSGPPRLFLDSPSPLVTTGDTLNITCYVGGVTASTSSLQLLREGVVITNVTLEVAGYAKHRFSVAEASFGHYVCELLIDGNNSYLSPTVNVIEKSYTISSGDKAIFSNRVSLTCDDGGSIFSSIYWYKNGQELVEFANSTHLEMNAEHIDNLTGVYQCFGERPGGVSAITTRVFSYLFSNPPANLKCEVRFSDIHYPWPLIVMDWDHPDYVAAGEVEEYIITANNGLNIGIPVFSTSAEVELNGIDDYETTEGHYDVFVAANRPMNQGNPTGAPARCDIRTLKRALDPPLPIDASCPDSAGKPVQFSWTNPLHQSNFNVPVEDLVFEAKCIYGNQSFSMSNSYNYSYDYEYLYEYPEDKYNIITNNIPSGAVCIAAGTYKLDHQFIENNEVITIPQVACSTPPSKKVLPVSLGLSCALGAVEMTWNTSLDTFIHIDNISLHTDCAILELLQKLHRTVIFAGTVNFTGNERVQSISNDAMCTFYGWYTDTRTGRQEEIPPAQCYMDQPNDRTFYPPVIVPDVTVYHVNTSSVAPSSSSPSSVVVPPLRTSVVIVPLPTSVLVSPSQTSEPSLATQFNGTWIFVPALGLLAVVITVGVLIVVVWRCRKRTRYNMHHLYFPGQEKLDVNYSPFKLQVKEEDLFSVKTLFDANDATPSEHMGFNFICVESVQNTDDTAGGNETDNIGDIPPNSDAIMQVEKNGSEVEGQACSEFESNDSDGKGHILSKFLTDINNERNGLPKQNTVQTENDGEDIAQDRSIVSSPTTLAKIVAHRMVGVTNSGANSSGYGTADGYNLSDVSEVSKSYLAQKLQDVEEAGALNGDETVVLSLLSSIEHTEHTESSQSHTSSPSPPLKLDLNCSESTDITAAGIQTLEAKTGSARVLTRNSAYYEDEKGYLHMGPWKAGHSSDVAKSL